MRNFILLSLLLLVSQVSSNELAWVDEQIEAIKPPRSGLKSVSIQSMKNPFIFLKKYKKDISISKVKPTKITSPNTIKVAKLKPKKLFLTAVMNTSALINNKWYKQGEMVNGYKLSEVSKKSVLLTKKSKKLILSTHSINKNLNFKNK